MRDDLRIRRRQRLDRYQLGSLVCAAIFLDNVLSRMGGAGESVWWWLASGRHDVLLLSGGLMLACQFLFWSEKQTTPDEVRQAVKAAFAAGAQGVVLSRKYSEMKLANLSGAGKGLAEAGIR